MKKLIAMLLAACVLVWGCGKEKKQEAKKEVSSIYEVEELETITDGDLIYKKPESWKKNENIGLDGCYEYNGELSITVKSTYYKETNDYLLKNTDEVIKSRTTEGSEIEILSKDTFNIEDVEAVEAKIKGKLNEYEFDQSEILFVYNGNLYTISFLVDDDSKTDYSKDWESLKKSIQLKRTEEISEEKDKTNENAEESPSKERETLASEKYEFNGGTIDMTLSKDGEEKYYYTISILSETPWKAAYAYYICYGVANSEEFKKIAEPSVMMGCGNVFVSNLMSWKAKDNGETESIDGTRWILDTLSEAEKNEERSNKELEKLSDELTGFITDFIQK